MILNAALWRLLQRRTHLMTVYCHWSRWGSSNSEAINLSLRSGHHNFALFLSGAMLGVQRTRMACWCSLSKISHIGYRQWCVCRSSSISVTSLLTSQPIDWVSRLKVGKTVTLVKASDHQGRCHSSVVLMTDHERAISRCLGLFTSSLDDLACVRTRSHWNRLSSFASMRLRMRWKRALPRSLIEPQRPIFSTS